ncbi:tetracycline resistance protein, class A-like isoform X2 [Benincasa hispida]|uniref:tetracycline resistance protein, class A-like isoform X2 n=1 Tax=Benincasa hispida TaxID=102211 RepID=UPI001902867F|nr:tetracycline resistance protein, class A-like isoform X2 [Benincasa hispida]
MEKLLSNGVRHLFVTVFLSTAAAVMVLPAITDVTMAALCPGRDECSLAIYLSGFQQALSGFGAVVITPLVGNLSDKYGRKALLTLPMTVSIIPLAILAYSRERNFFYAYYAVRTLTAMVSEGTTACLALAYLADNTSLEKRASAFGLLTGVCSAAFVCGTLASRFLATDYIFPIAAIFSVVGTVYMRIFLEDCLPGGSDLVQPMLKEEVPEFTDREDDGNELPRPTPAFRKMPTLNDVITLFKSSTLLSLAAVVVFFTGVGEGGMQASILYYLKARFHFDKNQFADLMLVSGAAGTISQLVLMPLLAPLLSEDKLLSLGLLVSSIGMVINSIAWAIWVPYVVTIFSIFSVFLRSLVSKQVGEHEQGKVQGCLSGLSSLAQIAAPLIFSPLTALFLSDHPPFKFPGFSLLCIAITSMIALVLSLMMMASPSSSSQRPSSSGSSEA